MISVTQQLRVGQRWSRRQPRHRQARERLLLLTRAPYGGGLQARLVCASMEDTVLRVRLISGDSMDVTYEDRDAGSEDEVIDHIVSTLADDSGVLRCRHGDRLLVLYARGVAAVEVRPRGAVL
jgi:hypothetical protein